jgi:hypothetical protein
VKIEKCSWYTLGKAVTKEEQVMESKVNLLGYKKSIAFSVRNSLIVSSGIGLPRNSTGSEKLISSK